MTLWLLVKFRARPQQKNGPLGRVGSRLLQHVFTFSVRLWPLVAEVIMMKGMEEVR